MPAMFVKQPVNSYDQWKAIFDTMAPRRAEYNLKVAGVFREAGHPNDLLIMLEFDDMARAKEFSTSFILASARQEAGVASTADVWFSDDKLNVE